MGKCITCNLETKDLRCIQNPDGSHYNGYKCEKCTLEELDKEQMEYRDRFAKKVLPLLLENHFKVVVKSHSFDISHESVEKEYPIKDVNFMSFIEDIRRDMESKGYYENWIDLHWVDINGVNIEIVDYICYALPNETDDKWVSFHFEILNDNGVSLDNF